MVSTPTVDPGEVTVRGFPSTDEGVREVVVVHRDGWTVLRVAGVTGDVVGLCCELVDAACGGRVPVGLVDRVLRRVAERAGSRRVSDAVAVVRAAIHDGGGA